MPATPVVLAVIAGAALLPAGHGSAPLSLALAPAQVVSGGTFTGTVTLASPAPGAGTAVLVTAPAGVTIQGPVLRLGSVGGVKVTVAAGQTTATFHGFVAGVATQVSATVRATSVNDVASATLVILPASVRSLSITPGSITGGRPGSGTIVLTGAAPAATGASVILADVREAATRGGTPNNLQQIGLGQHNLSGATGLPLLPPGTVTVPASVAIPPGASSATFPVTTSPVAAAGIVSIVASLGVGSVTTDVVVLPPVPAALTLSPATIGAGASTTATVLLSGPAPAPGFTVPLSSSSTFASIPKLVTVPAGADRQSFTVGTPPPASPSSGLTLSAGATYPAGPVTVVIAAVTPSGSLPAPPAPGITDGTSNTIQVGGRPAATLTILPPPPAAAIASFGVRPTTVTGGQNTILQLTLASGITTTQSVTLASDHPQLVQLPASILVTPPGGAALTVHTSPVSASTTVTITATAGAQQIPATLTLVP